MNAVELINASEDLDDRNHSELLTSTSAELAIWKQLVQCHIGRVALEARSLHSAASNCKRCLHEASSSSNFKLLEPQSSSKFKSLPGTPLVKRATGMPASTTASA